VPVYIFKHPDEDVLVEVSQRMTDNHVFIDDDGLEWQRVWSVPSATLFLKADVDSSKQFVDKTKGWSAGEMWDYSKELSEKRKDKRGYDQVEKVYVSKKEKEKKAKSEKRRGSSGTHL
jgi:hypothetical protein